MPLLLSDTVIMSDDMDALSGQRPLAVRTVDDFLSWRGIYGPRYSWVIVWLSEYVGAVPHCRLISLLRAIHTEQK